MKDSFLLSVSHNGMLKISYAGLWRDEVVLNKTPDSVHCPVVVRESYFVKQQNLKP
jgi:hypothetical protein